jgi:hypothetical protein
VQSDLLSQAKAAVASLPQREQAMIFAGSARALYPTLLVAGHG